MGNLFSYEENKPEKNVVEKEDEEEEEEDELANKVPLTEIKKLLFTSFGMHILWADKSRKKEYGSYQSS